MPAPHLRLGVNIDHVATVRNARGGALPDPVRAALVAIEAGADGITAHLREDRRHIRDEDMAAEGEITDAPELRDGRDGRDDGASRCTPPARRLPGARKARGADDRRRAGRREAAKPSCADTSPS